MTSSSPDTHSTEHSTTPGHGPWRNRDFRLVFAGGLVNDTGDWLLAVALPAYVYSESRSGRATAAVVVIELVVSIAFGSYGGSLADRWDLRRTIIATNLLQALTLLPLLLVTGDRLWPAFVVAGVQGLLREVNDPASFALLPRIVASEHLTKANAANAASSSIARLVGSPLGGIAVATGGLSAVVIADGVTFVLVALATFFVRTPTGSLLHESDDESSEAGVRAGWRELRSHPALVGHIAVQTTAQLAFAMFPVLFIAFVIGVLRGDEATVGIIRGLAAFGGLAASALVSRAAHDVPPSKLMAWGYLGLGAVAFAFVNTSNFTIVLWVYFVLFALSGLPNITSQVGAVATAQRLCPPALLGRFRGISSSAGSVGAIIGSVAVGLLLDPVGVKVLLNVQAGLYVLCGVGSYALVVRRGQRQP